MKLLNFLIPVFVASVTAAPSNFPRDAGPGWQTSGNAADCGDCTNWGVGWVALYSKSYMEGECACVEAKEHCFDLGPIGFGEKTVSLQLAEGGNGCTFYIDGGCNGAQYVPPNGVSAGGLDITGFGDKTDSNMLPAGAVSANGGDTWANNISSVKCYA
ncbi:hypothetical protein SLS60_002832 [Paraconiothyrium brasiliense]|uniref:Uncharacterized protein n=1 Tax=Paraconiothyrium brasiliense TaxID=300254 RepID=A0ABR3RTX9_9PLEO